MSKYYKIAETMDFTKELMNLFKINEIVGDDIIHKFAQDNKIDPHSLENQIYSILTSFFRAGRAYENGITVKDVNIDELRIGIKIEMEHTTDPRIALRISLDHLSEFRDYYTRLLKLEQEAKKELGE